MNILRVFLKVIHANARWEYSKREKFAAKMKEMFLKIVVANTNGKTRLTQMGSE